MIAVAPLASPVTSTGVNAGEGVGLPSWPVSLFPQHLTPPAVVSAQVNDPQSKSDSIGAAGREPRDAAGESNDVLEVEAWLVDPMPSWPEWFAPQHLSPPLVINAGVLGARREGNDTRREAGDIHRSRRRRGVAIAQLPEIVGAPALHSADGGDAQV